MKNKQVHFIYMFVIFIFIIGLFYSKNEYIDLSKKIDKLEDDKEFLQSKVNSGRESIEKYMEMIVENTDLIDLMGSEIDAYKEIIKGMENKIAKINELSATNLNNTSSYLDKVTYDYNRVLNLLYEDYNTLIYNNIIFNMDSTEEAFKEVFGEPLTEELIIDDGSVIAHMKGVHYKWCNYEDFKVSFLGTRDGGPYYAHTISSKSPKITTLRGVKVGDTIEELEATYSNLITWELPNGDTRYEFSELEGHDDVMCVEFNVRDGIIIEIFYFGYL